MLANLRRYFLSGLIVFLPLALTVFLFRWMLVFTDSLLGKYIAPYFEKYFGFYFRGLGILLSVVIIVFIGFVVTNYFGRKLHALAEKILIQLPFFKQVYPAFKEIALFMFSRDKLSFKQVVIVQYPSKGIFCVGFLTNETCEKICQLTEKKLCNVFVPTTPSPMTGYVVMIPKEEIIFSDLSIEDALRVIVSGGVLNPMELDKKEEPGASGKN
jgi:uncharacterized membrane protein